MFEIPSGAVVVDGQKTGPSCRFRYRVQDVDLFVVYVYDRDVLLYIPSSLICVGRRRTTFLLDAAHMDKRTWSELRRITAILMRS
jgi:hypothetical protein